MIGEPATGKSSIVKRFIATSPTPFIEQEPTKLVPTLYNAAANLHIIGRYPADEPFGGTDRLSMAVQPQAIKFIQDTNSNVLFEGDRLGTQSFLEFLADQPLTNLHIAVITAADSTIDARHTERNDTQSEQFKRGRKTKIDNLRSNMTLMGYMITWPNETLADQTKIVHWLINELVLDKH